MRRVDKTGMAVTTCAVEVPRDDVTVPTKLDIDKANKATTEPHSGRSGVCILGIHGVVNPVI